MPRLELVETSLRHGQQSLMVSRLRLRHALPVAETLDHCGFAALDVFGGSTFEASLRFLAEDERSQALDAVGTSPANGDASVAGGREPSAPPTAVASVPIPGGTVEVLSGEGLDLGAAERRREATRQKLLAEIERVQGKLERPGFVEKAPAAVVSGERERLARLRAELDVL